MEQYTLQNAWDRARRRLALLGQHLDPLSQRRLTALGVQAGWHCLEVGGPLMQFDAVAPFLWGDRFLKARHVMKNGTAVDQEFWKDGERKE